MYEQNFDKIQPMTIINGSEFYTPNQRSEKLPSLKPTTKNLDKKSTIRDDKQLGEPRITRQLVRVKNDKLLYQLIRDKSHIDTYSVPDGSRQNQFTVPYTQKFKFLHTFLKNKFAYCLVKFVCLAVYLLLLLNAFKQALFWIATQSYERDWQYDLALCVINLLALVNDAFLNQAMNQRLHSLMGTRLPQPQQLKRMKLVLKLQELQQLKLCQQLKMSQQQK